MSDIIGLSMTAHVHVMDKVKPDQSDEDKKKNYN